MNNTKTLTFDKKTLFSITQFVLLIGIAMAAPFFHQQIITGTIVNATLFAATMLLGVRAGILVGLIPSLIALSVGILPAVLAPMLPFIMAGNIILILTFSFLKNKNYWLAVILASLFKFLFIFTASSVVINLFIKKALAGSVITMMSWPQLFTALLGGLLANLILSSYKTKNEISRN